MHWTATIIKYVLYVFNLIFVVCGILLVILGSIMVSNINEFASIEDAVNTQAIPILVITLGSIVAIVSFFGCCGAIRENICCLKTYALFMFVLLGLQVGLIVWIFNQRQQFLDTMYNVVEKAWEENDDAHGYPMDFLQISFKCCGFESFEDYNKKNQTPPFSCCGGISSTGTCPHEVYSTKPGCRGQFIEFWSKNMDIIRYGGIGVAIVELIAFAFGCCLVSSIRKQRLWYYGK